MREREALLRKIAVGDIFHARSPNDASLICLTTSVSDNKIQARTVTSQIELEFDRRTGIAEWGPDRVPCTVDSVASLPPEIHNAFLELDRRYRTSTDPERSKLTDTERRAIRFIASYYPTNPI
jgi:hypothetical protein